MQLIRPEAREVGQLLQDEDGAAEVEDVYVLQHPLEVDLLGGGACSTLRHAPAADGTRLQNGLDVSAGAWWDHSPEIIPNELDRGADLKVLTDGLELDPTRVGRVGLLPTMADGQDLFAVGVPAIGQVALQQLLLHPLRMLRL